MKQQKISALMVALLVSAGVMAEDPSLKNPLVLDGQTVDTRTVTERETYKNTVVPSVVAGPGHVVVGQSNIVNATDGSTTVIGGQNFVADTAKDGNIFGDGSSITGYQSQAGGDNNHLIGEQNSAFGMNNQVNGNHTHAFGGGNNITGDQSTATGHYNLITGHNSSAFGYDNKAQANETTVVGHQSVASGLNASAFGSKATASGESSLAMGTGSNATADSAVAIGNDSNATGKSSVALGESTNATGVFATSLGDSSSALANGSVAISVDSKAKGVNSMAMGRESLTTHDNSVAVGSHSVSKLEKSVTTATVGSNTYTGFAGTTPIATVSVGDEGKERQVVNVAAGEISATSTDAINGSQLYAVASKIGDAVKVPVVEAGQNVTVDTTTNANGQTVYTVNAKDYQPAIDALETKVTTNTADIRSAEKLIDKNAKDIAENTKYIKSVEQKLPEVKSGDNTTVTSETDANGKIIYTVSSKDYQPAIDANTAKITEVEKEAKRHTVVEAGDNIKVTKQAGKNGESVYKVETAKDLTVNSVTAEKLEIKNGPSVTKDGIDANNTRITNVSDGVDLHDAVNVSQLNGVKLKQAVQGRKIKELQNSTALAHKRIDTLDKEVRKNRKRSDAGIAGVAAMANIPQVYLPGKSGVGVGVGHKHGQSALAIGASRSSDNGKHIVKVSVSFDTQKDTTVGAGYMYQW